MLQAIDWWGPKLFEYYAGSEGNGFCALNSEEWLAHKGSVGKALTATVHILDDDFKEVGVRQNDVTSARFPPSVSRCSSPPVCADTIPSESGAESSVGVLSGGAISVRGKRE